MPRKKTQKKVTEKIAELDDASFSSAEENTAVQGRGRKFYLLLLVLGLGALGILGYKYLVVGWVDRKPITRFEFYSTLEKRHGKEVLEQLVSEKLILGEARNRRVSVGPSEIGGEVAKIESQQGGADKLEQALKAQGISMDELKKQLGLQILIKKMFGESTQVTDEEVNKYIEENKQFLLAGENENQSSVSAKLKEDTREQLRQQKLVESFNAWLKEARGSKRVSGV